MSEQKNRSKVDAVPKVQLLDWQRIPFQEAWDRQSGLQSGLIEQKRAETGKVERPNYLVFCEHPHVFTLGKSGSKDHLIWDPDERDDRSVEFVKINRGGDITYHGPGQLVCYPIFDLEQFFTDVHKYVRSLEEVVMRTLDDFGIESVRVDGYTGVWLEETTALPRRKICAIGVHLSRWVSMHGLALNVNTDLSYFRGIVPCGIESEQGSVTSMQVELGQVVDLSSVKSRLGKHFREVFTFAWSEE